MNHSQARTCMSASYLIQIPFFFMIHSLHTDPPIFSISIWMPQFHSDSVMAAASHFLLSQEAFYLNSHFWSDWGSWQCLPLPIWLHVLKSQAKDLLAFPATLSSPRHYQCYTQGLRQGQKSGIFHKLPDEQMRDQKNEEYLSSPVSVSVEHPSGFVIEPWAESCTSVSPHQHRTWHSF